MTLNVTAQVRLHRVRQEQSPTIGTRVSKLNGRGWGGVGVTVVAGRTKLGCSQASLTPSLQPELFHECQVAKREMKVTP